MQDFNSFSSGNNFDGNDGNNGNSGGLFGTVSDLAKKFDGKSNSDLLKAIYSEAEKGKRNGTLSNADLDRFKATVSPFLDGKKKKILDKLIEELKEI